MHLYRLYVGEFKGIRKILLEMGQINGITEGSILWGKEMCIALRFNPLVKLRKIKEQGDKKFFLY